MRHWITVAVASLMLGVFVVGCSMTSEQGNNTPDEQEALPEAAPQAGESTAEEADPAEVEEATLASASEETISEETVAFEESTQSSASENLDLTIGDTAEINGLQATLLEVFTTQGSKFDRDYYLDQPGTTFLIARFQFVNNGQDSVEIGGSFGEDFIAYTQDGYQLPYASLERQIASGIPREDEEFSYTEVRPGANITGTMAWVAGEDDTIQIEYQDYFAEDILARWQVGPVSALEEQDFGSPSSAAGEQY